MGIITRFTNNGRAEDDIRRKFGNYLPKTDATSMYQRYIRTVANVPTLSDLQDDEMVKHENGEDIDLYIRTGKGLYKATFTKIE